MDLPAQNYSQDSTQSLGELSQDMVKDSLSGWGQSLRPSVSGVLVVEGFSTNYLDPYSRSDLSYVRIHGRPTIELAGLPFEMDFFVTTEENSFYNSNTISFNFNVEQFKKNQIRKAESKFDEVGQQIDSLGKLELEEVKKLRELGANRYQMYLDSLSASKRNSWENHLEVNQVLDSLVKDSSSEKGQDVQSVIDTTSLVNNSARLTESIDNENQNLEDNKAKLLNEIEDRERRLDSLRQQLGEAHSKMQQIQNALQGDWSTLLPANVRESKLLKLASRIEKFNVGMTYPFMSRYSLNGIPVKGLDVELSASNRNLQMVCGKTFSLESSHFGIEQPRPVFTRNVLAIASTFEGKDEKWLRLSTTNIFDPFFQDLTTYNMIQSLESQTKFSKIGSINIGLHHASLFGSSTLDNNWENPAGLAVNQPWYKEFYSNLAMDVKLKFRLHRSTEALFDVSQVNPGYVSLGNPYLRSNFRESQAKLKGKLFKGRVRSIISYKHFMDNLDGVLPTTNTMKGYGISIQGQVSKELSLFAQYSPYQQGNNNPDTLFRTDNQLSVSTATLIYLKKLTNGTLTSNLMYVNSDIDYNNGEHRVNNSMLQFGLNIATRKIQLGIAMYRNQTGPVVDTLNFSGARFTSSILFKKGLKLGLNSMLDVYDQGAMRQMSSLRFSFRPHQKIQINIIADYGIINGLFELEDQKIWAGKAMLSYQL